MPSTDERRLRLGAENNRFRQVDVSRARLRNRLPQNVLGRTGTPSRLPVVVSRLKKWKTTSRSTEGKHAAAISTGARN